MIGKSFTKILSRRLIVSQPQEQQKIGRRVSQTFRGNATMSEPVRFDAQLQVRCASVVPVLVKRAALRRGLKEAEWLRQAVATALRADGLDPTVEQQYALVAVDGHLVAGPQGPFTTYRPEPDDRGQWLPVHNEDSEAFDPAKHYRAVPPLPLRVDGNRVVRTYQIVDKAEWDAAGGLV